MPKPSAKERILDAYEEILIEQGPGVVTLESVAAHARVSKGGLLYHFGSKEALLNGLMDRLSRLTDLDIEKARDDPDGVARWYLRSAITDVTLNEPLHRTTMATIRMVLNEPHAAKVATECQDRVRALLAEHIEDPLTADLVTLVGDGLYMRAALASENTAPMLDQIEEIVTRLGA